MGIHYRGPHQRVSLPLPNGREIEVAKGKDIDLRDGQYGLLASEADEVERGLLDQPDCWSEATTEAAKPSKSDKKES